MRTTIFKQYKDPWASLPFPKGSTVKGCGCGLCSVVHVIIESDAHKNETPATVQPYMVKWAVKNQGLIHDGIPDTLRHYGMENVKEFGYSATMKQIWSELNKGARKGVILFGSTKGPDGTVWTGGGHFIAFLDFKIKDGQHWFYLKDSGPRDHDGWFCYEKSMRGDVRKVWTCTIPGAAKTDPIKDDGTETVIDVSYVQKSIDWNKVKAAGVKGAIIRCGYRGYAQADLKEDTAFKSHIQGAAKAGLKVGVYFFTEAINAAEGKAEAAYALQLVKASGVTLSYPVAVDTEYINAANVRANSISKAKRTEAIKAFCEECKRQGYESMIYASTDWLNNKLDMSKLPYKVWVAQYNDRVTYKGNYVMWQYTSTGKVNGVTGVVDMNRAYSTGTGQTDNGKRELTVDGRFGRASIRRAQEVFKTTVDGVISGQSTRKWTPGIVSGCIMIGKGGSDLVRAIQKEVGTQADGLFGPATVRAVQKWLGVTVDSIWGAETSKAFQRWLNKQEG